MQSREGTSVFYYQASANALGGFFEKPFERNIRTRAAAVLPAVGGYAAAYSEAFRVRDFVSFSSATVEVSGHTSANGFSIHSKSVVEDLNILGAVRAARVVGEVTVHYTPKGRRISFGEASFKKLRIGREDAHLRVNPALSGQRGSTAADDSALDFDTIQRIGSTQAKDLVKLIDRQESSDDDRWALNRYGWMQNEPNPGTAPGVDTYALCSLIDGIDGKILDGRSLGHVVEIPNIGRFFFGEVLISRTSVQLSMIRAELGCKVVGGVHVGMNGGGGHTVPPVSSN